MLLNYDVLLLGGEIVLSKILITGGSKLKGNVTISGAKNAAVAIIPATILAKGKCVIENIPDISDIRVMMDILSEIGATIKELGKNTVSIDTSNINCPVVPYELAKRMRASYYFLGAMVGRYLRAEVSMPGGCDFGVRPIDQHIKGFESLGITVSVNHGMIDMKTEKLVASHIYFDVVSVGATINTMLAAVKAEGVTILENVAKEPHIVDLANFLNSMGADIMGAGTDVIKIHGVSELHGTDYSIIPDQIEAGTFMVAAAATEGDILIKNVIPKHLESISDKIVKIGAEVEVYDDSIRVIGNKVINKLNIKTLPYPGFPTDMQPQIATLLSLASGTSVITEGIWDNRFKYVDELRRLGACIQVDGKIAIIEGVKSLKGAPVIATDLRAGAAMLIAGLMARGTTEIEKIYHIERGYENIVSKLKKLGANIRLVGEHNLEFKHVVASDMQVG